MNSSLILWLRGRLLFLVLALLLIVACDKSTDALSDGGNTSLSSIAYLKSLCEKSSQMIYQDIAIEGTIVSNQSFGEFPDEIILMDETGGISLEVQPNVVRTSPSFGHRLRIDCRGLLLTDWKGKVRLAMKENQWGDHRLMKEDFERHCRVLSSQSNLSPRPSLLTFPEVQPHHIGTFVRLDNVHFVDIATHPTWCDMDVVTGQMETSVRAIEDLQGASFRVVTHGECSYAKEPIPTSTGSLEGIIDVFNGELCLRLVNHGIYFHSMNR